MLAITAGRRAIITSSMTFVVLFLDLICGDEVARTLFSILSPPFSFSFF
jgi:hypothetical protein